MGASGSVGDAARGGGGGTCEKNKTGSTTRWGGFLPWRKLHSAVQTHRKECRGLVVHVCFISVKKKKKLPSSSHISRRFLRCSQPNRPFSRFPLSRLEGFFAELQRAGFAPRTTTRACTHAHLVESIHDRKSAVSHQLPRGSPPSLPLSFDSALCGRRRGFEMPRPPPVRHV